MTEIKMISKSSAGLTTDTAKTINKYNVGVQKEIKMAKHYAAQVNKTLKAAGSSKTWADLPGGTRGGWIEDPDTGIRFKQSSPKGILQSDFASYPKGADSPSLKMSFDATGVIKGSVAISSVVGVVTLNDLVNDRYFSAFLSRHAAGNFSAAYDSLSAYMKSDAYSAKHIGDLGPAGYDFATGMEKLWENYPKLIKSN